MSGGVKMKPKVFVGSSAEGLPVAYAIQEELEFDSEITVWKQDVFRPGTTTIEALESALLRFDFAVFVMSPDDRLVSRGRASQAPRDNIIFELGLFIGRLGRDRVFFVVPRDTVKPKIPTDLLGVTVLSFEAKRSDGNMRASLGTACNQPRRSFARGKLPAFETNGAALSPERQVPTSALKNSIETMAQKLRETSIAYTPAIIFADLDGFSAINKWFGSKVCDRAIATIDELFRDVLRNQFWVRFGGDQFIVCLKVTKTNEGKALAKAIVRTVANRDWSSIAPGLYVTVSVGVATSDPIESISDWVVRAIHGSIMAKKSGGNQVADAPLKLGRGVSHAWSDYAS
jgi:diguanylate cyclase (GGDEF)-like protein